MGATRSLPIKILSRLSIADISVTKDLKDVGVVIPTTTQFNLSVWPAEKTDES